MNYEKKPIEEMTIEELEVFAKSLNKDKFELMVEKELATTVLSKTQKIMEIKELTNEIKHVLWIKKQKEMKEGIENDKYKGR